MCCHAPTSRYSPGNDVKVIVSGAWSRRTGVIRTVSNIATVFDFDGAAGPREIVTSNLDTRSLINSSAAGINGANRSGFVTRPYASSGGSSNVVSLRFVRKDVPAGTFRSESTQFRRILLVVEPEVRPNPTILVRTSLRRRYRPCTVH